MNIEVSQKKNIAEYIIYMYQTEDLIRAYELDLNDITKYVVANLPIPPESKKEKILWYAHLIEQMQQEDVINNNGHLKSTQVKVQALEQLHVELIKTDAVYLTIYKNAEDSITEHIELSNNLINSPIQICLNSLYGMLLLKLNAKPIGADQQEKIEQQSDILSYLSKVYNIRREKH